METCKLLHSPLQFDVPLFVGYYYYWWCCWCYVLQHQIDAHCEQRKNERHIATPSVHIVCMYIERASLKPIYLEEVIGNCVPAKRLRRINSSHRSKVKSREEMEDDCRRCRHRRRRRHSNNNGAFIHLNSASHLIIQAVLHHVFVRHVYQMSVIVLRPNFAYATPSITQPSAESHPAINIKRIRFKSLSHFVYLSFTRKYMTKKQKKERKNSIKSNNGDFLQRHNNRTKK